MNSLSVMKDFLSISLRCIPWFAVTFASIGEPPDFFEDVAFIEIQTECFDDVLTLSLVGLLVFTLWMRHLNQVVIVQATAGLIDAHSCTG